jgi:hypothetical protein
MSYLLIPMLGTLETSQPTKKFHETRKIHGIENDTEIKYTFTKKIVAD